MDEESDKIERLEDRIEQLEAVTKKMMPSRRDALKLGGAAAIGAAAMSGTASAGSNQVGTIGDANNLVDIEAEDVNASDTITTQDLVVNGTATGPFGGGGIVLESGDSITVKAVSQRPDSGSFFPLYNGSAKDVLGGVMSGESGNDFRYTFSDNTTLKKNPGTTYDNDNLNQFQTRSSNDIIETDFLPPAKDVIAIEVASTVFGDTRWNAEVILKD